MIILPIVDYVERLLKFGDYEKCDMYISMLDKSELSDSLLSGLVEVTHGHMPHLPNWERTYNQIHDEIIRRGLDPQKLLPWMYRTI